MVKSLRKKFIDWITFERPNDGVPSCDFDRIRYELRPCDVLLIEGRSRISEVIRHITQSSWSHASIYIGRIHDVDDPELRKKLMDYFPGDPEVQLVIEGYVGKGTVATPLENYREDHIRICRPRGLSRKDAQKVMSFAIKKLGTGYDERHLFDLARFLIPWSFLPRRWRSSLFEYQVGESTKTICSTMIAEAFAAIDFPILPVVRHHHQTGVELIMRNPRLITPRDFDYSPYFEIIKYPFVSFAEGPYRSLPWNREGLFSIDGKIIHEQSPLEMSSKSKLRKKIRKIKKINKIDAQSDPELMQMMANLKQPHQIIADVGNGHEKLDAEIPLSAPSEPVSIDMSLFNLIVLKFTRMFGLKNKVENR